MKRYLAFLLALLLCLSACGAPAQAPETEATELPQTTEATEALETEATEEETHAPAMNLPTTMEIPAAEGEAPDQESLVIPADAKFAAVGEDLLVTPPIKGEYADPVDPFRPGHNLGTCKNLSGRPYILYLFVSDNESTWNAYDAENFIFNNINPALTWLEQQAAYWDVYLDFDAGYYITGNGTTCHYNGILNDFDSTLNNDVLEQISASLGFSSKEYMHSMMQQWTGCTDILYMVIPNKPGRCFAIMDWTNDGYDYMEYNMIFAQPKYTAYGTYEAIPATIAHEILHNFGAEDYYSEGTARVRREQIAQEWFPGDVMLALYYDINYNYVGPNTAHNVGWRDVSHISCHQDGWWD